MSESTSTPPIPTIDCHRAAGAIRVDGRLDEPAWQNTQPVTLEKHGGGKASFATSVKVLWDDKQLYLGFECDDPEPTGRMTQRDDKLWEDANVVEAFIDPTGKGQSFFEFEVNPLNTLLDLFFETLDQSSDNAAIWNARDIATAVDIQRDKATDKPTGWSVEIAIPFDNFTTAENLPPKPDDTWRINFYRYNTVASLPGSGPELNTWSQTMHKNFDVPARFGFMRFCQ